MRELIDNVFPKQGIKTILDVGAGDCWFTDHLTRETEAEIHVAVDIWEPSLEKARAKGIPGLTTFGMDVREYLRLRADAAFDAVLAIDLVEHFKEEDFTWMLGQLERVAKHLVIVWTTYGFVEQGPFSMDGEPNPYQEHFYGPMPEDFKGWNVDVHADWHGDRGGGMFCYKFIEPIPEKEE